MICAVSAVILYRWEEPSMSSLDQVPAPVAAAPKLLNRSRTALLKRGTKPDHTERYVEWVRAFNRFQRLGHPDTLGETDIGAFLTGLTSKRCLPLAEQAQAR